MHRAPGAPLEGGARSGPSGFDAGKKVLGRKRHVLVDTQGLLLNVDVHAADIQDRDGAETLLRQARRRFPFVERIVADGGYAGPKMRALVARTGSWTLEIVKRSDVRGFVVLPKRWIVERTLAWHQPQPASLARLRATNTHRRHLREARHDPHHAQAPRRKRFNLSRNFSDGLLVNADRLALSIYPEANDRGFLPEWAARMRDGDEAWLRVTQQGVTSFIGHAMAAKVPFAMETVVFS